MPQKGLGAAAVTPEEQQQLRKYLLGQLAEADEEQVELRLLTDSDYSEEADIVADELIDEYVEGNLPAAEIRHFEGHFLKSQARQEKLRFALALKKRKAQLRWARKLYRFYLPATAAALLLIGLGVVVWRVLQNQSEVDRGLAALQAAYREQRPIEARISDFAYAPVSQQRGEGDEGDYVQRDLAARLLLGAVAGRPSAESHRAVGQYYLTARQFDKAVDQYREALRLDPEDAKAHSDLGAALLEKGKLHISGAERRDAAEEFAESLRHLNKALELDGSLAEALFNRALLYQHMKLPSQAEEDWRAYLGKDPNSRWAEEARRNLSALEEQRRRTSRSEGEILRDFRSAYEAGDEEAAWGLFSSYHNRTGNIVFEQALDSYLKVAAEGRAGEAGDDLRLLSYAAELARRRAGDRFFSDLVRFYESVPAERMAALARARALMKEGHGGWGQSTVAASLRQFGEAKELFEAAGDICEATVAGYWVSFCYYRQRDQEQSMGVLRPLMARAEASSYKLVVVRVLYLQSIINYELNKHSEAAELADRSLLLADQTADRVGQLNALSSLIEYYRYFNNFQKSVSYIQRSLPLLNSTTLDPVQGCRHYGFVALSLAAAGWYDAAAAYQKEALQYALMTGLPATISYNLAFLSQINGKLRRFDEALNNARAAFETAESNSDDPADRDLMAYASLQMGHIYKLAGDYDNAVASYNRSIELYERAGTSAHLYQAYKGRLLTYIARGDDRLVQDELLKVVSMVESYRDKIFEDDNRRTFFDAEQNIYDLAIGFTYSRLNAPDRALEYSESSRARAMLDLVNSDRQVLADGLDANVILKGATRPLPLDEIRRRLPEPVQVLQYSLLKDELLIWVVSREGVSNVAVHIPQKELEEKVGAYLRLLSSISEKGDELPGLARELHDSLIKPVEPLLDKRKQVYVVPDKILNLLPFGTLVSSRSGRYMIEDYVLALSPSSTMLIVCTEIARGKGEAGAEKILSIGNPQFDRDRYPSLPDLPSAAREATMSAAYYNTRRLFIGDEPNPGRVVGEMQDSDVIHLALHSILDERFPLRSKFVMARARADAARAETQGGALFAYELYGLRLPRTRLAVLSACQTGGGRYFGGEGVINMARPFIAAGVPLVVASLWPIDSGATAELMIKFHELRKVEGLSTAEALRLAQINMLRGPEERLRRPYYWAPFVLIGGYAEF